MEPVAVECLQCGTTRVARRDRFKHFESPECPECGYLGAEMKANKTRGEFRKCLKCGNEWDAPRAPESEAEALAG